MGGARRHCHCNLNNKRGENIITVDSAHFKFNVDKISTVHTGYSARGGTTKKLAL